MERKIDTFFLYVEERPFDVFSPQGENHTRSVSQTSFYLYKKLVQMDLGKELKEITYKRCNKENHPSARPFPPFPPSWGLKWEIALPPLFLGFDPMKLIQPTFSRSLVPTF